MSNKIVQLKDKTFTDNIYPIAGGMAADSITTQMLKDNSVTSDKIDFTTSTVAITIGGKSATANKVDLGGGLVYIGGHITLTNFTTNNSVTNIGLEGLPTMSTVISCGIEGAQIGQAGSYISYPHFYAGCYGASFYLRNTTSSTTSAIEINFHVFGVLSTS